MGKKKDVDGFPDAESMGEVVEADCLMFLAEYSGRPFDLVYLDPPYFLEREFRLTTDDYAPAFKGTWSSDDVHDGVREMFSHVGNDRLVEYLSWLHPRLRLLHSRMAETGSIFLHIGSREAPYVSILLDSIFGFGNWRSTITWQRSHPHNNVTKSLGNVSDVIFYYSKSSKYTFNLLHTPHDSTYLSNSFNHEDAVGPYALAPIIQERSRKGHHYVYKGVIPPNGWRVRETELKRLDEENMIHWGTNRPYKKVYLHETQGAALQNIWTDIYNITRTEVDSRKYPTQKPVKLLERIVSLASNEGDLVYDPFCGSGTTLVAAQNLGRAYLGTDISPDAVSVAQHRLAASTEAQPRLL